MHFYRFACKIVLKMTTEMRKRRDMGNPLQAVNSKYRTVDTALVIMSQSKRDNANTFRLSDIREPHFTSKTVKMHVLGCL